jgi:hypothetical protein
LGDSTRNAKAFASDKSNPMVWDYKNWA